jgi:IS605 OrfB family transposase
MLDETVSLLNAARAFYIHFFLAHTQKLTERVPYYSEKHLEIRERVVSANELLTWAESCTVETSVHPEPLAGWSFTERFPGMPFVYRRSVIKDAVGKVRSYLSNTANWKRSGKKKGGPGLPGARDHPTLYQGTYSLQLAGSDLHARFVRLKVYDGGGWRWVNYPVKCSRYLQQRLSDKDWESKSPLLVLRAHSAELHFPQTREIAARRVRESKLDPDLVTVAVDLNVKQLAVITVRQHGTIIDSLFITDHGLDQLRYRHLRRIAKKQWQSGKPVKGEHSNHHLWQHVRRMNDDAAHKLARIIAGVCSHYPGCVLLFERLRKIKAKGGSKSRRTNRKLANQLRGKINQKAREKAFVEGIVTVEVNPHGTSQYCSRCGLKGERFSLRGGKRINEPWGKLFWCPHCRYQVHADWNGSVNVHHSFFKEWHWQMRRKVSA